MPKQLFYEICAVILFFLGLLLVLTDGFGSVLIRSYLGDVLVVMFIYSVLGAVTKLGWKSRAAIVLLIAILVECTQLLHLRTGITSFDVIVLGSTFDPLDIIAYAVGLIIILAVDQFRLYLSPSTD